MKVKVKLISLNVKTKILPKCITIQRNQKYLTGISTFTWFPVGYEIGVVSQIVLLFVRVFSLRLQIYFLRDQLQISFKNFIFKIQYFDVKQSLQSLKKLKSVKFIPHQSRVQMGNFTVC